MYSKVNTKMYHFEIIEHLTLKWAYEGLLSSLFLKNSACGLSPLERKLSFPSLDFKLCIMLIYSIIVANDKYEFNNQDKLFEFSTYFLADSCPRQVICIQCRYTRQMKHETIWPFTFRSQVQD